MATRRAPRPVTEASLREAATRYLHDRDASRARLRRVLMRRVEAAVHAHGQERDELVGWVEALLADFVRLGYLDDARFAAAQTRALRARGASKRGIEAKLREKGVPSELVAEELSAAGPDDELRAALRLLRRRRAGPFRRPEREGDRQKELASLGRAGFSYEVAARAWGLSLEEAEERLRG